MSIGEIDNTSVDTCYKTVEMSAAKGPEANLLHDRKRKLGANRKAVNLDDDKLESTKYLTWGAKFKRYLTCSECSLVCKNALHLKHHTSMKHKLMGRKKKDCSAGVQNDDSSDLTTDNSTPAIDNTVSEEGTEHSCLECPKSYSSELLLELHQRLHEPYECQICGKSFPTLFHLREHIVLFHDNNYTRNQVCCPICSYPAFKVALVRHLVSHVFIAQFKCRICSHALQSRKSLWAHIKMKHESFMPPDNIEKLQCSSCGNLFRSKYCVKKHIARRTLLKRLQCTICSEVFYRQDILDHHITLAHSGPTEMKTCEYCQEKIPSYNFSQHYKSHVNQSYCVICKSFFSCLARHKKLFHSKKRTLVKAAPKPIDNGERNNGEMIDANKSADQDAAT